MTAAVTQLRDPIRFIETLINPETGQPFTLLACEREFLKHAYTLTPDGRLLYPEQVFGAPKKTGKSTFAALHQLCTLLLYGGRFFAEGYVIANDFEQAQSKVFEMVRRIVEASPALAREAKITADRIVFSSGATICALASDYASAAGGAPVISVFDELWAYSSERARRLFDEMIFVPTRPISCRLTVTYAGFTGESELLENLYRRGLAQPQVGPDLHAGDGILMFWTHEAQSPWQTPQWLAEMKRSLRGNQYLRMIENRWVSAETVFVPLDKWDRCVDPNLSRLLADRSIHAWAGVDASVKHDSTALVLVTLDKPSQRVRLLDHKVFQPSPDRPLDFERSIENTILEWHSRFALKGVLYDPYQMQASAQRLAKYKVRMEEFPQTSDRLTMAGENLYSLIMGRNLWLYPDPHMRVAISHAVAVESARGWKITKLKQSHRIDIVVALAMAALAAVKAPHPQRLRMFSLAPPGPDGRPILSMAVELDPATGRPLEPTESTAVRWQKIHERDLPAIKGVSHGS